MKIINPGNPWWVNVPVDCKACGCSAKLELRDRPTLPYDLERLKYPGVSCPTCGEWIHVPEPLKPVAQSC